MILGFFGAEHTCHACKVYPTNGVSFFLTSDSTYHLVDHTPVLSLLLFLRAERFN